MGIFISFILILVGVFYLIGLISVLSKAGASVLQIVLAVLVAPYRWYLLGTVANKKIIAIILLILMVIGALFAFTVIKQIVESYSDLMIQADTLSSDYISREVYENTMREKSVALVDQMESMLTGYILIMSVLNIVTSILEMIIFFFIGKEFEKSVGFCIGLALLPAIFIIILGFDDSVYGYSAYSSY